MIQHFEFSFSFAEYHHILFCQIKAYMVHGISAWQKLVYNSCAIFSSSESTPFSNALFKDLFQIRGLFLKANLNIALACVTLTWKLAL